ncbi:LOW QUALITY PROTEIN: hypothetical protein HID58_033423 [Brassica napus]|uniref:C-JID domain-containing protein n=1 Tax=Brassica napus TaxID=3708 RepID=A0ABQ8C021_BRANA|nr:LOW QUALITY PROTEIN: hypothetical protein HID58_033423 [Brassica napus]
MILMPGIGKTTLMKDLRTKCTSANCSDAKFLSFYMITLERIDTFLGKRDWISDENRIVISISDALITFNDDHANPPKEGFPKLSEEFVHYARGHPLALKMLDTRPELIPNIGSVFQMSYDGVHSEHKVAFPDIACFRSENVEYVESLLASESADTTSAIKALKNKELDPKASTQDGNRQQRRLWLHQDIMKGGMLNSAANVLNMEKLQRRVVLNMKNCQNLEKIPVQVGELKALQELILSDCSNLKYFPEIDMMISVNILLLDGTAIEVMPQLPSVQYLCLSRSKISCLPAGISQLFQLKWLDLKYCKCLTSVPEFPPNLQFLDAHGCSSLKTIAKPLARIMPTEQNHSTTFIFTNCKSLEQAAKEEISSYAQRKCQLLSYARSGFRGFVQHLISWMRIGSELEVKLLPHWHDKRLAGIALCAVVSFNDCHDQISRLSVTCNFKVKVEDKSWVPFPCPVGSWTRQGDKIESDHVFIGYTNCPYTIKFPEDENSDKCSSTEASLEFTVAGGTNEKGKLKVLKCGLGLVYAKDKSKNSCHEAKYDMPVGASFQEISEEVDGGGGKKKKKTRGDDGRPKKKKINIPCQSNSDARRKDSSVIRHVENLQAADESVPS